MTGKWRATLSALAVLALVPASAQAAGFSARGLRIDNRADQPLGVDDTPPALSWKLTGSGAAARQTAYEVAPPTPAAPSCGTPGRWRRAPGTRPTRARRWRRAAGPLAGAGVGRQRRRVRLGADPVTFEMGLLRARDDWGAAKSIDLPAAAARTPPGGDLRSARRTHATSASTSPSSASRLYERAPARHRLPPAARRAAADRFQRRRRQPRAGAERLRVEPV